MRILRSLALIAVFAPFALTSARADPPAPNVKARLISESSSIAPGRPFTVALEFDIRDGWHTYWRNPGDSGQATKLAWTLPAGFLASQITWTRPHRFEIPPLVNFGYAKHAMHLVQITPPADLKIGTHAMLKAKADWLVCSDVCIPESADLDLDLPVTAAPVPADRTVANLFASARAEVPKAEVAATRAAVRDGRLELNFRRAWSSTLANARSVFFFPYDEGSIEYAAAQSFARLGDSFELAVKLGYSPPKTGPIKGVIVVTPSGADAPQAWEIAASFTPPANAAPNALSGGGRRFAPTGAHASNVTTGLPGLLLLAALGGLILNLMPCVFPVLSIKAVGLVEQARRDPAKVRIKGLVFAAGVIASMLALAATLLALRAGGEQIGWGFQLQSPFFVTLMAYLLLAVGLNLSGAFEFGGGLAGAGDELTQGDGLRAAFFTGVLTTLVATPCTAPFMAAAVGAALTQSTTVALLIFVALGLGLSLPYLLLCFAPWLRRLLPKPGAWMDTLKQLFAFPMYASAAWLLWVLAQQTSPGALAAALAGSVLIGLSAWAYQKSKDDTSRGRIFAAAAAAISLTLALYLPWHFAAATATGKTAASTEGWEIYDPAKVDFLSAAGTPILVNFTASWCLTCLVNERAAFSDEAVKDVFRRKHVVLMKGDWTNRDPVITAALAQFGRAGVPLYLAYNSTPGQPGPVVLPQLLTASAIRETFAGLPDR